MPLGSIIDAHVHLWDPHRFRMAWLDGDTLLNRPHGLEEYRTATAGLEIEALVYVQVEVAPAYALLEARWAAEQARAEPRLGAIVAWAPLEDGHQARSYLEALVAVSPLVKGVRRIVQDEPDPAFCSRPGFVTGARLLPEYGLTCDLCIRHYQLAATMDLARQCPETHFILDHCGKPAIKEGTLEPWREQIADLATLPNVLCKMSGLVSEADHAGWRPEDLAPYVAHVLDCFGAERVLFGGDWPVLLHAAPYRRWVEALESLTAHLPRQAQRGLWAENARRFYRLPAPAHP